MGQAGSIPANTMKPKIPRPSGISADTLLVILSVALVINVLAGHRLTHPSPAPVSPVKAGVHSQAGHVNTYGDSPGAGSKTP